MEIGGGVTMLRTQYLAGLKEERAAGYPTVPRLAVQTPFTIDGTIDDVFAKHPELEECLYNDVKVCTGCGKPCAFTMTVCNSCGKELPEKLSKSENVFSAFLFGVKSSIKGFPLTISLRRETEDVLIGDDMLQLCPCHLNGIPKKYYIPDWRYLLKSPKQSLELLDTLEAELWAATLPYIRNDGFRKGIYRGEVTDEDIRNNVIASFNFPPSQFQLHMQWLVPPLTPFQHFMAETRNHFHYGRGFPVSYVRHILELDSPYPDLNKDTPIEKIIEHYRALGVDYEVEWPQWYDKICLAATMKFQNWQPDDFEYVVQEGKAYNFSVVDGKVELGEVAAGVSPPAVQAKDKTLLQNFGRPYSEAGKPSGTYIQKPLEPKIGAEPGGYQLWPPQVRF